jgi:hypothetical protein
MDLTLYAVLAPEEVYVKRKETLLMTLVPLVVRHLNQIMVVQTNHGR